MFLLFFIRKAGRSKDALDIIKDAGVDIKTPEVLQ
jgi:oligoendopeptidase F